jgi:hypothetical protein
VTIHSIDFLLAASLRLMLFWKEFSKRGRADFWTNAVIGRLFNS